MFSPEESVLLIVDVQGKLAQLMYRKEEMFLNLTRLIQAAQHLNIPVIYTEQVPEKLGPTIPAVAELLKKVNPIPKAGFSCLKEEKFARALKDLKRPSLIVAGIEAHICVYQTVVDLIGQEYGVQVVGDAVSSRTAENKQIGLERIRLAGAVLTSTEMILCELLKTARHPKFKEIVNLIK